MSGSGEAAGGGGALAAATGAAEGGSKVMGGGQTNLYPVLEQLADIEPVRIPTEALVAEFERWRGRKAPEAVDYTTMSGAELPRAVGVDPEKWAAAFLQAYAQSDAVRTEADRLAFVAGWFRDAMDAARKGAEERGYDSGWDDGKETFSRD